MIKGKLKRLYQARARTIGQVYSASVNGIR